MPAMSEPLRAFGHKASVFELPTPMNHVRHGLISGQLWNHPALPSWLGMGVPHRLFRNGVTSSIDDIISTAFILGEQHLNLTVLGTSRYLQASSGTYVLADRELHLPLEGGFEASYHILEDPLHLEAGAVIFLLNGKATCDGIVLEEGRGMAVTQDTAMTAERSADLSTQLLLLRRI